MMVATVLRCKLPLLIFLTAAAVSTADGDSGAARGASSLSNKAALSAAAAQPVLVTAVGALPRLHSPAAASSSADSSGAAASSPAGSRGDTNHDDGNETIGTTATNAGLRVAKADEGGTVGGADPPSRLASAPVVGSGATALLPPAL
jgi:hypothetical protein